MARTEPKGRYGKVLQIGGAKGVTIPPAWLKRHQLEVGDWVVIEFDEELTVRPAPGPGKP